MKKIPSNIKKIYISNLLAGLIFWYGIEKLFLQSIGIEASGIGIAAAIIMTLSLLLDIPSGILADRWSRKGVLFVSTIAMAVSSLLVGMSNSLPLYLLGSVAYALYNVAKSGTYQALIYDSLHEKGLAAQYSKVVGRSLALFLVGCGVADILSGFVAQHFDYRFTFFMTIVPCIINVFVIASINEPTFHRAEQKERALVQIRQAFKSISQIMLLRGLAVIMTAFAIIELFKGNFGQLYFLRYMSSPELLGILWAGFAFSWAIGSFIAHRLHARLGVLVFAAVVPLVLMSFIDHWVGIGLYLVQAIASAALLNQIETRVQDATPSSVRASVLSVLSALGQIVCIPAGIGLGWLIHSHTILWAVYAMTGLGVGIVLYWLWLQRKIA